MSGTIEFAGEMNPQSAWDVLASNPKAALVDVRTDAEFAFVGVPDLSSLSKNVWFVPWKTFPGMAANDSFVEEMTSRIVESGADELLFLCRSGARSMHAAQTMSGGVFEGEGVVKAWNVAEGFEGDLNGQRRRGRVNGWKAHDLPWVQS